MKGISITSVDWGVIQKRKSERGKGKRLNTTNNGLLGEKHAGKRGLERKKRGKINRTTIAKDEVQNKKERIV